jgi:UDP-N-acetylmuramate--alanine ligase
MTVHFIGIGGAGMSGIARVLLARGTAVSGSDAKDSLALSALRALGADVHVGHDAAHVTGATTVVMSTAIRETNPELRAARASGVRVLKRAEALAELLVDYRAVAVAGTHGKTTTTSMLTVAAQHCGVDPSFAIGGDLNEAGSNAHHGRGDLFVVEADESDASFLVYRPYAAIVTNVEPDHLDHYQDEASYRAAFEQFVETVDPGGFVVVCADDGASTSGPTARPRTRTCAWRASPRAGPRRATTRS